MSYREAAGRCASHIRLKGHTKSTLVSKHDKRGVRDSLVPRPTSTWGVITYAYASGLGRRKLEDSVTAREGGSFFGVYLWKLNVESRRLAVKL